VRADDREMIFHWRNDPFVLAHGSSNRKVTWDEHAKWFADTLGERGRKVYVVVRENVAIGQVRFDYQNDQHCVISAYLLKEHTGHGWGVQAIREACTMIFTDWRVPTVVACIRKDNPGGRSAFLKAGFQESEDGECPHDHYSLVLRRRDAMGMSD